MAAQPPKVAFPQPQLPGGGHEKGGMAISPVGPNEETGTPKRSSLPQSQTMSPSKSTRSEQSPTLEERELRKELDEALQASNNLLGFIGTIAVFIASVGVSMLSFVNDKFFNREDSGRTTDHVIYACLYVSICLALIPAALCVITHSGLLQALASKATLGTSRNGTERQSVNDDVRCNLIRDAIARARSYDDSLFWVAWFVFPSVVTLITSLTLLVWSDHAKGVATAMTAILVYCCAHVSRLLLKLGVALYKGQKVIDNF